MGYVLVLLATLAWSFVGVLVKTASPMLDSFAISFGRFFFGVLFLGIYMLVRGRGLRLHLALKWIWIGGAAKAANYLFENAAITLGYSYSNILIPPVQTTAILLFSAWLLRERVSGRGWTAAALCMLGVGLIGWNGMPLEQLGSGGLTMLLLVLGGTGAGLHVISQRRLVGELDSGSMNLSAFAVSALLLAPLPPLQPGWGFVGEMSLAAWAAVLALGLITGLSFVWFAEGLKRVPLAAAALLGNVQALFTMLWSVLFFDEPMTIYVGIGAAVFIGGILWLQLPLFRRPAKPASAQA
ncbi:DMT family transporter [Paenibacillus sp. B01]|uniref:DMT family transporter n=1 Tax=Paenibacillus sp. B01 TaxID=2660554 RepID=UPI00129A0FEE|nr:DMT family transporter [Paenibacillus sp. B01]QGG58373.1 EamA family transporter [Paenibacillus sp. B01]